MSLKILHFQQYDGEVNSKLSFFEIYDVIRLNERYHTLAMDSNTCTKINIAR